MIKKFDNFNNTDEIKTNLEDMLVDLSDNGIDVKVIFGPGTWGTNGYFIIQLGNSIEKNSPLIIPSNYKDDFLRIFSYLKSEDFKFRTFSYFDPKKPLALSLKNINYIPYIFDIEETPFIRISFDKI